MLKINRNVNFDLSSICSIFYTSMDDYFDLRHDLDNYRNNCDFNNSELDKLMFIIYNS